MYLNQFKLNFVPFFFYFIDFEFALPIIFISTSISSRIIKRLKDHKKSNFVPVWHDLRCHLIYIDLFLYLFSRILLKIWLTLIFFLVL